jgi:hypothetical protein
VNGRVALGLSMMAALAGAGCAFGDGDPFGELEATLHAGYELLPERDRGDDWQKLDNDFEARITGIELEVITIDLQDTGGAAITGGFDPASPPPGYSLCHNGHCHRDDGALVPYEDIAADGGSAASTVAALPVGPLDLLARVSRTLECAESCQLARGHIGRARLFARQLDAQGEVRDGRATPRFTGVLPWTLSKPLGVTDEDRTGLLDAPLDLPIDREEPPLVVIELRLRVTAKLLDGIAFDEVAMELGATDPLDLAAHDETSARVGGNFAESELTAVATRNDE